MPTGQGSGDTDDWTKSNDDPWLGNSNQRNNSEQSRAGGGGSRSDNQDGNTDPWTNSANSDPWSCNSGKRDGDDSWVGAGSDVWSSAGNNNSSSEYSDRRGRGGFRGRGGGRPPRSGGQDGGSGWDTGNSGSDNSYRRGGGTPGGGRGGYRSGDWDGGNDQGGGGSDPWSSSLSTTPWSNNSGGRGRGGGFRGRGGGSRFNDRNGGAGGGGGSGGWDCSDPASDNNGRRGGNMDSEGCSDAWASGGGSSGQDHKRSDDVWAGGDQDNNGAKPAEGGFGEGERPAPYRPSELDLEEEAKLQVDTVGENFKRYRDQKVTCIPLDIIKPIEKFEDVIESKLLLDNVKGLRYDELTPIQKWAMPAIIGGYDLIGCAQTGSGKTAAFLLPILQTIMKLNLGEHDPNEDCQNPFCIIISPTRELAKQIFTQSKMLSKDSLVKSCYIYGQISTFHLKAQLSKGCHILVATLGRLKDFVQRGWIGFKNVKYMILDEGDRLVDDGFSGDLKGIFEHESMPPRAERQTLFFSATFKKQVQLTAKEYLKDDFIFITVGRVGAANEDIKQEFLQVARADKKRELRTILNGVPETDKTIIFTQTKAAADMLAGFFNSLKLSATSIHGDRHQSQREEAISVFRRGEKRFLISSPVGNRGLDLPKVSLVINYDLPDSIDEYVHRIGRTGRAGHTGRAISFLDLDRDREILPDLKKILKEAKQEIPPWLADIDCPVLDSSGSGEANSSSGGGSGEIEVDWGDGSTSQPAGSSKQDKSLAETDQEKKNDNDNASKIDIDDVWVNSTNANNHSDNFNSQNKRQATDEAGGCQKKLDTSSKAKTSPKDDTDWWC